MDRSNSSFSQYSSKVSLSKRCENIPLVMSQVQACSWCTFRLGEIVTIEKCLQEVLAQDPRLSLILRKIGNESVFVEPERKIRHLNRTKQEEQADNELKRRSIQVKARIEQVDAELQLYQTKIKDVLKHRQEQQESISNIEESINSTEKSCKLLSRELELLLERTFYSFNNSFSIITNDLLDYMQSTAESNLIKQLGSLPALYRQSLIRLIRSLSVGDTATAYGATTSTTNLPPNANETPTPSAYSEVTISSSSLTAAATKTTNSILSCGDLSLAFKRASINRLNNYLRDLVNLYKDSILVDSLHTNEIPEELLQFKALEEYLGALRQPLRGAPQRITYVHSCCENELNDMAPAPVSVSSEGHKLDSGADNVACGEGPSLHCELLSSANCRHDLALLPDRSDDHELARLISSSITGCL